MPKATKRERQRQNRDARRLAMQAAEKRHKQFRAGRNLGFLLLPVVVILVVISVTSGGDDSSAIERDYAQPPGKVIDQAKTYTAIIDTSEGEIQVELDAANSLKAANNFVFLSKHKFYNGLRFVRVAKDFVIQSGSPKNTTSGGPGYSDLGAVPTPVAGQPAYPVGTVAMAKSGNEAAGTFGSQFFIVTGTAHADLSPDYAIVGKVTSGLDVAQEIGLLYPTSGDGKPTKRVTIKKIAITDTPSTITEAPTTTAPTETTATTVAP